MLFLVAHPTGRASAGNKKPSPRLTVHIIRVEERLVLKRFGAMMFRLVANIADDFIRRGWTDRERAIS